MGHIRLGELPHTRRWDQVVELITRDGDAAAVAAAALEAARHFFGELTRKFLTFFLSRELSNHVGGERRFASIADHAEFDAALELHCRQASHIVEEFAGGWFSKANWEQGITPETVRGFAWVALKKLRAELRKR